MKPPLNQQLPDDIEQLKKLLMEKLLVEEALKNELAERVSKEKKYKDTLEKQDQKIGCLEETIRYLKHLKFGQSSEKFNSKQADLFNEAEELYLQDEVLAEEVEEKSTDTPSRKSPNRKPRTLQQLPEDIQRHVVYHDLPESEKRCDCGCMMSRSGCERSEQLEVIPPQFSVTVHARHTYACKKCEGKLKTASKPAQPIAKSFASASLLAYIITSKYFYALPLHRQEKIYESLKIPLKRNTMANWVINAESLVAPVLKRFEHYLIKEDYIQCDETRVQVLNEKNRRADQISQMWVRRSMGEIPILLFNYSPSRSGDEACRLLEGFSGYLQTDDYAGYNKVVKQKNLVQLGCNAHARRRFDEARKSELNNKAQKSTKRSKLSGAVIGLLFYKRLYKIEKQIKDAVPQDRFNIRLTQSVPLFKKFIRWAEKRLIKTTRSSKLGKALSYLIKNKTKLMTYCSHEKLNIDNNLAEGAIRPFVVGRKNWLFSNSAKGAKASAAFYSLVETAKANGLNVFDYLKHLFEVLPSKKADDDIDDLLPWNAQLVN